MAGIETLTRGVKRNYEEWYAQQPNGVDRLLFPIPDEDTCSGFAMDKFIHSPHGVVYRDRDNPSHVIPYSPGTGYVYDIPRAAEKTPITEELRDMVIVGLDPNSSQAAHYRKLLDDIRKIHVGAHNVTKWKQALDVIFDGEFYAKGSAGTDIDLDIDYSRDSDNELTHDFTSTDTIPIAFKELQDQLVVKGCSLSNMVVICGSSWLHEFGEDSDVQAYLQANTANQLLEMQMMPPALRGNPFLRVLASYRAPEMLAPVYVCAFNAGVEYVQYSGAAASAWVTATKCAMFSLDSPRYRVLRGVDALSDGGKIVRSVGDIVLDGYTEKDPVAEFVRSQSRHLFIPANVDHTAVSTGTFS